MRWVLAGIDEAGYGPMLGPLAVSCAAMLVEEAGGPSLAELPADDAAGPVRTSEPDLWSLLERAVARELRGSAGRLVIADSKKLKLANSTSHPLRHLERGVLAMLSCATATGEAEPTMPTSDIQLLGVLGVDADTMLTSSELPWYGGEPIALPTCATVDELRIDASTLRGAMAQRGVRWLGGRVVAIHESEFNAIVRQTGSKAHTTLAGIGRLMRWLLGADGPVAAQGGGELGVLVRCDRLGGRASYGGALARVLPGSMVRTVAEGEHLSRYRVEGGGWGMADVVFEARGESVSLVVALASMQAKLVRELMMARLNRWWSSRVPELRPTAGYVQDARRWLRDLAGELTPSERSLLVRLA